MGTGRATAAAAVIVIIACVGTPGAARAQQRSPEERAVELYERSEVFYREGRFDRAAELLREAYATFPDPTLLYNLARAYEGSGDVDAALSAYRRFLVEEPGAEDRGAIERRIATLRAQIAERDALERERALAEERRRLAEERARRAEAEAGDGLNPVPWVVGSVGVVGLAAGSVLGILALDRHDAAVADQTQVGARSAQTEAEDLATAATVAFVAGGVLTAIGATWIVIDLGSRGDAEATVGLGPGSIRIRGTF